MLYAFAGVVTLVTVLRPFWAATYPPLTDLPFHAAQTSVFRHWFDSSYHYREQFELSPMAVPYVTSYVLGAIFMLVLPAVQAVKAATAVMLLAVPIGLAILSWGMRKTPLLGLAGLPFVWCNLTHWGFINFVSALGMFAAVLGLTMRVLDRPTRRTQIALGALLVLLFFTHVFRYPYALAGVALVTGALYPVTKRFRPVMIPTLPSLALFGIFLAVRPSAVGGGEGSLGLDLSRRDQLLDYVIGSFTDPAEASVAKSHLIIVALVGIVSFAFWVRTRVVTRTDLPPREGRFAGLCAIAVAGCVAMCLVGYFTLPMQIGIWWYVFPREATAALFLSMALLPDLPELPIAKAASSLLFAGSAWAVSSVVVRNYEVFDRSTQDFEAITESIPPAPRLLYLVFDHSGSTRRQTPYIHLPAYVQAERGGHLSFHFAMWDSSPVRYRRDPDAIVAPKVPLRWEWQPSQFRVREHGPFFDWFLVRSKTDPTRLFQADPTIEPVRHEGTWWLYRRRP